MVALLIGTLVGFGALQIATHDERLGQRSIDIAIVDEAQVFDDDLLRSELGDVSWGRHVRMLVYVVEATEDTAVGLCTGDAVVFWLDPEADAVSIEAKNITHGAWEYLPAFLGSASGYAGHLLTRAERLDIARRVRRDYTQASLNLDELKIIGVVDAGRYTPTLEARIAQWQLSYAEFARLMFDAHDMSKRELARRNSAERR